MRFTTLATILLALASPGTLHGEGGGSPSDAAAGWVVVFQDGEAGSKEIERARAALQAMAAGSLDDPDTRLAAFALAREAASRDALDLEAMRALSAATSLFPDDRRTRPLLRRLARARHAAGDPFGAHIAFTQLLREGAADEDPALLALAADTAARIGDPAAAHEWAGLVDPTTLEPPHSTRVDLARVKSAESLARYDLALESIERLEATDPEALRLDAAALLAAARVREGTGLIEDAAADYEVFVNLFPQSEHRPDALFALSRILHRTGKTRRAEGYLDWLTEQYPNSPQAARGRLQKLELDGQPMRAAGVEPYLELIRRASGATEARAAAERFSDRMLADGLVVELIAGLAQLAGEPDGPDGLSRLIARDTLERTIEPVLTLLAAREDAVALAAVVEKAAALGIPIPRSQQQNIVQARRSLGLPEAVPGALELAVADARAQMTAEAWAEAAQTIDRALRVARGPYPTTVVEAVKLLATCRWREGRSDDALAQIDRALRAYDGITDVRALRVLRGDVLFSSGSTEQACQDYEQAAESGTTRWVSLQLERCHDDTEQAKDRSKS